MKSIFNFVRRPFQASMSDFDAWWTGYAISIPGLAGSLLSFLYFGAGIWAVIGVAFRRFPLLVPRRSRLFAFSCVGYGLALLLSSILNDGAMGIIPGLAAGAAFYFVPFIIARYRFSSPQRSIDYLCAYAPLGAFLSLVPAFVQEMTLKPVEAGAGNASVLGYVSAMLGAISLANGLSANFPRRLFAFAGFLAGMGALLLSRTRALYPVIILVPAIFLYLQLRFRTRDIVRIAAVGAFAMLGSVVFFWQRFASEFAGIVGEFSQINGDASASSLRIRIELWKSAFASIVEAPWFGHGQLHKMDDVLSGLPDYLSYVHYSHAHNIFIDNLLSGGIFLFSILILLLFSPIKQIKYLNNKRDYFRNNYMIMSLIFVSIVNGLFNTLFTHDIMATIFLFPLILLSSLDDFGQVEKN